MKKNKLLIIFLILISSISFFQKNYAQQTFCLTDPNVVDFLGIIPAGAKIASHGSYTVRIFVHIIRRTDGTGGVTQTEVDNALNIMTADYEPQGICFSLYGIDEIHDDNYYNFTSSDFVSTKFTQLVQVNSHTNAIDIYLLANDQGNAGRANGIPGSALVIGGVLFGTNLVTSHVLSHEFGHCLGLYHTHHGTSLDHPNSNCRESGCRELVDGSNCTTCGDFVCDTPPDLNLCFDVDATNCTWNSSGTDANGESFNPDELIIMSYTLPNCMQYLTNGEGVRMRDMIANSTILQNATVPEDLVLQSQTLNFTALYAVSNTITVDNITIPGGANITFVAGQEIIITESVIEGELYAYIDNQFCSVVDNINSARYAQGNDTENKEKISFTELKNTIQDSYFQNYPNPFNSATNFHYFVEKPGAVSLTIYCIHGTKISTLVDETQHPKGAFSIPFNGEHLPNGIYLCNLKTEKYNIIQKINIVK